MNREMDMRALARLSDELGNARREKDEVRTVRVDDLAALIRLAQPLPVAEKAGEVVALRIVGRNGPYGWHDASEMDKENPPEMIVGEGERVEYAYAQPLPVGVPDGLDDPDNPWRRAVEHAGYLVTAVAHYMEASANEGIAIEQVEGIEEPSDEQLEELHSAQEDAGEARTRMRDLSYEFTKRRDRALATLAAAPAPAKAGKA